MATDPRKRQKKLEKRAAKRKEKKHELIREQSVGLPERLTAATRYPVLDCWVGEALDTEGIGQVGLSRQLPGGEVAVAVFLVDRYCLGVKDAFGTIVGRAEYDDRFIRKMKAEHPSRPTAPADARKLVEDAVAYARELGLPPHADYFKAVLLFGPIRAADSTATFEFGKDGKPFFVAGPFDGVTRCRQILATLTHTCGPDGFHFVLPASGRAGGLLEEMDDFDEEP